ncbi:MAG: endonuclease III [Planctomycetes bacterium]|nr:endonuclease III [Planctomycetota bacterium]
MSAPTPCAPGLAICAPGPAVCAAGLPTRRASLAQVLRRLRRAYGPRPWRTWGTPLDELVGTILSQNTNDRNSDAAWRRMRATYPQWNGAADAPPAAIAAAIRPAGLHRQKARSIRAVLRRIRSERGSITLDFLRRWPTQRIKDYLLSLPGVGPKTAACVLLFSTLRRPVLPVDTHVCRVSRRLGLIGPRTNAEQAHGLLAAIVPPRSVYAFHVLMIEHGRKVCHARRPECGACCLNDVCPSAFTLPAPPTPTKRRPMRPPRI